MQLFDPRAVTAALMVAASALSGPLGQRALAAEEPSPLVTELLRRTEANRMKNAATVRRVTEQNAYTGVAGDIPKLVTAQDGSNLFLTQGQVFELTRQGRLACGIGDPCRIVEGDGREALAIPTPKRLACDGDGRNCRFRDIEAVGLPGGGGAGVPSPPPSARPSE